MKSNLKLKCKIIMAAIKPLSKKSEKNIKIIKYACYAGAALMTFLLETNTAIKVKEGKA